MGVITTPFLDYNSCAMVLAKENNTQSFSSVVSSWTKVTKEHRSRACLLAQWRHVFLCRGVASQKFRQDYFFAVWLVPLKTAKFNHPRKFVLIRYQARVLSVLRTVWLWELDTLKETFEETGLLSSQVYSKCVRHNKQTAMVGLHLV